MVEARVERAHDEKETGLDGGGGEEQLQTAAAKHNNETKFERTSDFTPRMIFRGEVQNS